jgi:succinate-semialdehyde dehydrogenase / glutarate-semialdehyde dehydrogenase
MAPDLIADPETDPTATYAVDPALGGGVGGRGGGGGRGEEGE